MAIPPRRQRSRRVDEDDREVRETLSNLGVLGGPPGMLRSSSGSFCALSETVFHFASNSDACEPGLKVTLLPGSF